MEKNVGLGNRGGFTNGSVSVQSRSGAWSIVEDRESDRDHDWDYDSQIFRFHMKSTQDEIIS